MAVFSGVIRSNILAMDTGVSVILPYDRPAEQQRTPCKVLYLLHGLGDNSDAWRRYTAVEIYAREKGVAVIMPEVQRSFYTDMAFGMNYFSYIVEELPQLCGTMFNISTKREDTYIAGLSMGGYGAMKCGLTRPDIYKGCASFSGALDIVRVLDEHADVRFKKEFSAVLGMELVIEDHNNLMRLADKVSQLEKNQQPDIFITCGRQDFLHEGNVAFCDHLDEVELEYEYREWQGDHTWDFWNESVRQLLDFWLPDKG